jgi:ABC-type branched-subunit amino acid transport system substrate-binding protein
MNVQTQFLYAEPTVNDFGSYILKIKQFHPDAIWVSLVGNPTYSWARQLAQSGYKGYVLTGDAEYQSAQFLEKEGQDANYALTNAVTYPTAVTPKTLPFYKAYQKATGIYPAAYYAVNEYDGMQAAFEAMRRSGGLTGDTEHDRAAIQKGLESITQQKPFEGIRGSAESFAPLEQGHHMVGSNIVIAQIQNGKQVPVWPEDVASAAGTKFVDPRTH